MSRTDHHRPDWVQAHDPTVAVPRSIHHDHTDGICRVEDIYDAARRVHRPLTSRHRRRCAKRRTETWTCTKDDARREQTGRFLPWVKFGGRKPERICWNDYLDRSDEGRPVIRRTQCLGHSRTWFDDSVPCLCDDWVNPTCRVYFAWTGSGPRYRFGRGPNRGERAVYYHRPERRRERDELGEAAKLHRGGDDLEDFDFVNRQTRGSVLYDVF